MWVRPSFTVATTLAFTSTPITRWPARASTAAVGGRYSQGQQHNRWSFVHSRRSQRWTSNNSNTDIGGGPPTSIAFKKAAQQACWPLSCARRRRVLNPGIPQAWSLRYCRGAAPCQRRTPLGAPWEGLAAISEVVQGADGTISEAQLDREGVWAGLAVGRADHLQIFNRASSQVTQQVNEVASLTKQAASARGILGPVVGGDGTSIAGVNESPGPMKRWSCCRRSMSSGAKRQLKPTISSCSPV